jgi:hypothetical protein
MAKKIKPHLTKYTVVYGTYVRRFDTLEEGEQERDKAIERGEIAWIVPPVVCICNWGKWASHFGRDLVAVNLSGPEPLQTPNWPDYSALRGIPRIQISRERR